jgi:hypothetical protein
MKTRIRYTHLYASGATITVLRTIIRNHIFSNPNLKTYGKNYEPIYNEKFK